MTGAAGRPRAGHRARRARRTAAPRAGAARPRRRLRHGGTRGDPSARPRQPAGAQTLFVLANVSFELARENSSASTETTAARPRQRYRPVEPGQRCGAGRGRPPAVAVGAAENRDDSRSAVRAGRLCLRIWQTGTPLEVYDRPRTPLVAEFSGHSNVSAQESTYWRRMINRRRLIVCQASRRREMKKTLSLPPLPGKPSPMSEREAYWSEQLLARGRR